MPDPGPIPTAPTDPPPMWPDAFADRVRAARTLRGLTREEVAAAVGVHTHTLASWESGTREPRLSDLHALAAALDVSVGLLIERSET